MKEIGFGRLHLVRGDILDILRIEISNEGDHAEDVFIISLEAIELHGSYRIHHHDRTLTEHPRTEDLPLQLRNMPHGDVTILF